MQDVWDYVAEPLKDRPIVRSTANWTFAGILSALAWLIRTTSIPPPVMTTA